MPLQDESPARPPVAPNAILDHMRRRIGRIGLLVAFVSLIVSASVIFFICACASLHH
jgi:hypothetical protein